MPEFTFAPNAQIISKIANMALKSIVDAVDSFICFPFITLLSITY